MEREELKKLVDFLTSNSTETEWIEFKRNFHSPVEIGERISALSNSANIHNKPYGYLVFGIEDGNHNIVGTSFKVKSHKKGDEDLELWLVNRLNPRIDFESFEFDYGDGIHISLYKIPATINSPVEFINIPYIRVGSMTKKLAGYREKEAKIWKKSEVNTLDKKIAKAGISPSDVVSLLSIETYFDLMRIPQPHNINRIK